MNCEYWNNFVHELPWQRMLDGKYWIQTENCHEQTSSTFVIIGIVVLVFTLISIAVWHRWRSNSGEKAATVEIPIQNNFEIPNDDDAHIYEEIGTPTLGSSHYDTLDFGFSPKPISDTQGHYDNFRLSRQEQYFNRR